MEPDFFLILAHLYIKLNNTVTKYVRIMKQTAFWREKKTEIIYYGAGIFFNFSTPVYKMWIIQEPNTSELWNKLHFEEGEKTDSIYHV